MKKREKRKPSTPPSYPPLPQANPNPNLRKKKKKKKKEDGRNKTQQISSRAIEKVVVHPLVLSASRQLQPRRPQHQSCHRVCFGSSFKGTVDVTNSYAVPLKRMKETLASGS
ncbi:Uncharacterized protein M6B38_240640 [Iris pallida]|uniref:Uncharacterized protein n=1 Tax=Iris pallida TaxID=29817 RepID=A0AAX6DK81_IRIPA|nr:Uncharacterized protein M6B38_240640 [Iris pallida]